MSQTITTTHHPRIAAAVRNCWHWRHLSLAAYLSLAAITSLAASEPVDINSADAAQIARAMKGVGMKVATRIVTFREKYGLFPSVDALVEVRGVGKKLIYRNQKRIVALFPESELPENDF